MAEQSLKQRIAAMIGQTGPMPLADYMQLSLFDARQGYYPNRQAIGADGDFITAPEISQMFGELVGIWCAAIWQAMGRPDPFLLAEAGPGRGTAMADMLRAASSVPGFTEAARVRLIEASPAMIERQRVALAGYAADMDWLPDLDSLPDGPLILIANEFLDCLPMRQFIKRGDAWLERCIGTDDAGNLIDMLGAGLLDPAHLPPDASAQNDGAAFEMSPAREAWLETLALRLAEQGGAALIIDYGHDRSGFGDTFQAMRGHAPADPLAAPGTVDLTSHVDFAALTRTARGTGATVSPCSTQGAFLLAMGLLERAGRLGANRPASEQERISGEVERLAGPDAMGTLFKVLALAGPADSAAFASIPPFAPEAAQPHD